MAPQGRKAAPDGTTESTLARNGLMSMSARLASPSDTGRSNASAKGDGDADGEEAPSGSAVQSSADVPFPADGISAPKGKTGSPAAENPAADADRGGERLSAAAAALNGRLDSGRQAVRQAVAATNSWIANRAAKDNSPDEDSPSAARPDAGTSGTTADPALGPAKPRPSFTPAQTTPARATPARATPAQDAGTTTAASSGRQVTPDTGRPSRRDTYTSPQPTVESQPTAAAVAPAAPASGNGAGPVSAAWGNRGPSVNMSRDAARRSRRQAHLTLARVEPWSVMKFSFMVSVVAFVILFVAIAILYMVLSGLGVFTSLQHTVSTLTSSQSSSGTNISKWFSASRILDYTGMLGALNIVLITAMSTIGAVIYNLIAHTIGGVEVTLRETE
jgi:hypothetical protein